MVRGNLPRLSGTCAVLDTCQVLARIVVIINSGQLVVSRVRGAISGNLTNLPNSSLIV